MYDEEEQQPIEPIEPIDPVPPAEPEYREGRHYWHNAGAQYNWGRTIILGCVFTVFILFALWDFSTQNGAHLKVLWDKAVVLFNKLVGGLEHLANQLFSEYQYK